MHILLRLFRRRGRRSEPDEHLRRLLSVGLLVVGCLVINAACFRWCEGPRLAAEGKTLSFADSLWLSLTTITTVGYGDYYAATFWGRAATVVLLYLVGLACFPYALTELLEYVVERGERRRRGMEDLTGAVRGHIIVANFPSEAKVRRVIALLRADPRTADCPIVIVAAELSALPFQERGVRFVAGPPEEEEALRRANVGEARAAIVLAPRADPRAADALTAAAVTVIETLNPGLRTAAELSNPDRRELFQYSHCDGIIPTEDLAVRLLTQEVCDPGVAPFLRDLLTSEGGAAFYSVPAELTGWTWGDLRLGLAQRHAPAQPVGLLRGSERLLSPGPETVLAAEDRLILMGGEAARWPKLAADLRAGDGHRPRRDV